MNRLVAMIAIGCSFVCQVASAEIRPVTYTYKQVGELPIKADVYRGEGAGKRPVVVWIHGGGFQEGSINFDVYGGEPLARQPSRSHLGALSRWPLMSAPP